MTFYTCINYFKKSILYFLFTIPLKPIFKDFAYLLGTAKLRTTAYCSGLYQSHARFPVKDSLFPI